MVGRSTIQHLRFGFSLFLMPVYWFALSQATHINPVKAIVVFIILHLLVYPASNGYNSYMDKDKGSIGGVKNPLLVKRELFYLSVFMDAIAIAASLFISVKVAVAIFIYITASRLYSYRGIRLKKFPVMGYLTVILCQGALVYYIVSVAVAETVTVSQIFFPALITSLLIGGTYPLTQVYQHEQDKADGVTTLSYLLGVKGTFVFCGLVLLVAVLLLTTYMVITQQIKPLLFYFLVMAPVAAYFTNWFTKVDKNKQQANFKNVMQMNYVASTCSNIAFIGILVMRYL